MGIVVYSLSWGVQLRIYIINRTSGYFSGILKFHSVSKGGFSFWALNPKT